MKKKSYITVTDMFCGAGGSSQGVRKFSNKVGGGVEVSLAMNHWALAVKTHATNFPEADHDCANISESDPRRYNSTDILIASPECTNHSLAKGKPKTKKQLNMFEDQKTSEDRSRATMWDVPRFAEAHGYNIIITENVVDAKRWIMYDAWLKAMDLLGYAYQECYFNSMHFHPTPQSRDRLYVVFWKKKNRKPNLEHNPIAWCEACNKNVLAIQVWKPNCLSFGKYRTQYEYRCSCSRIVEPYYYAALNCINFAHKSERIGDRKIPLKPNTMRRVNIGIDTYWNNPFIIYGGDKKTKNQADRTYGLDKAIPTQCAQPVGAVKHGVITPPFQIELNRTGTARDLNQPISTQLGAAKHNAIITSEAMQMFIGHYYKVAHEKHFTESMGTCTAKDRHYAITMKAGERIKAEDCYYRMIKSDEVGKAMAFEQDYIVHGNERQKVRQYGNAVTPPVMEFLIERCIQSLA